MKYPLLISGGFAWGMLMGLTVIPKNPVLGFILCAVGGFLWAALVELIHKR